MDFECMTRINHYCQVYKLTVVYDTINMTGPAHDPEFTVLVKINGEEYGTGSGKSKKEAKAMAAKKTWEMIEKQCKSPSNMAAAELTTTQATLSPALDKDYVSLLNIFSQRTLQIVDYPNRTRTGDAHAPTYSVSCTVSGVLYGKGTGSSLAAAKQAAAKEAYEKIETEGSNGNFTFSKYNNSSQVPNESDSDSDIRFDGSAAKLVEKMKDMAICEKPSPSQRNAQSSALKPKRKLAVNFPNERNKEEEKKKSDSNQGLPDVDTNTGEDNGSPHTVNKTFLENFKNIEPIGEGGFGNVFKATSKCDKITYAIKRVEFTEKVEREAEGLARLTHENIVRYHSSWKGYDHIKYSDSSQNSDKKICCLFIQMEFCKQGTLEKWIAKNREDRKYYVMAQNKFLQIVKGVEYIHSEKLIHRDLKPQNIFISHDDKIKIGDFGLVTSVAFETLTEDRGTKSYMAPEQSGARYGKEVDIYALGLIWFEILSTISHHEKTKVWPSVRKGELPEDFTNKFLTEASIIQKMLSTNPSGRISISDLLVLLKSVDKEKSCKNYSC
ncbi:interferon-induced, double-stranded RNA-activated protein kinase isoform X1 [Corvus hawaiiensis]|uniref:interferon-induced, double-stranded RNA-activated protein kinase isoform X1 n=1 Tax=Corvus hawaiiensis TaxID=134902 RepID=UPI0020189A6F|nr:interferon-induced, double-stranded RNA-activated protein kinase isoform X1 [Corvus hawaiiensis]XP_048154150.1 interferon-induced, double-stranded RNA-activated protein kinase isoform X1 [Corvus hawaiiensis]XP_048154151.1 interferon-induced, double-stranded RNA-activated protein kinase isoform X1 [Corvus hawaiiensis]XP_048154153.1 interferon-induced, double-stranded RNA-activated protein kinase isoform X1 [Corvus hawaiiensis]